MIKDWDTFEEDLKPPKPVTCKVCLMLSSEKVPAEAKQLIEEALSAKNAETVSGGWDADFLYTHTSLAEVFSARGFVMTRHPVRRHRGGHVQ